MPLYEYTCLDCHRSFEMLRKFSEAEVPAPCPRCGSEETVRHLPVFVVHGSGNAEAGPTAGGGCACGAGGCGCH
ncbi:MAG: zinc ribbon domain-containing protein [Ardenticatenia bacterium]|nr:zinc ribbon domain-containing protein [Ardenticatenia bacterium]